MHVDVVSLATEVWLVLPVFWPSVIVSRRSAIIRSETEGHVTRKLAGMGEDHDDAD
jgi:hypothetical protein